MNGHRTEPHERTGQCARRGCRRTVLALALALIGAAAICQGQTNGPVLTCDRPIVDFGEHENTSDVEHTFVLKNAGTEPVVIGQVRAGCGCSKTELSTNTIAPGAGATLQTSLCIKNLQGPKRTSVYLHSNDPAHPVYQLQLMGTAVSVIEIEPRVVSLQWRSDQAPPEAQVAFLNKSTTPFGITRIQSSEPAFSTSLVTNEAGKAYVMTIRVSAASMVGGWSQGTIDLTTDHPRCPKVQIPVSAFMQPELLIVPAQLVLPLAGGPAEPLQTRYIVVRSAQGKEFHVKSVESSSSLVPVGMQTARPTWARIRVGPFAPGPHLTNAVVTVRTDLTGMESIVVPFRAAPASP